MKFLQASKIRKVIIYTIGILALTAGCSSNIPSPAMQAMQAQEAGNSQVTQATIASSNHYNNELPPWVRNPQIEDGIGIVGIAKKSKLGVRYETRRALTDARYKLASEIQTIVSGLTEESARATLINEDEQVEENFNQAVKEIVKKIPLSGVKQINSYKANDGTLYIHAVISTNTVKNHFNKQKRNFKNYMQEAGQTRAIIDEGMKVLDKSMDKLDEAVNN